MQNFKDKVVLVTGGNSGIGRSAALRLAERGARVAIAARRRQELEAVVGEIQAAGGEAIGISADIADPQQIDEMMEAVISSFGRLDAAFNNAGVMGKWDAIDACDIADFEHAIGINLRGTWLCARAEIIQIKKQGYGGAIANTSSWLSQGAIRGSALYSITKAGLDATTRALTFECADHGIRINNVAPGVVDTPMTSSGTNRHLPA